MPSFARHRSGNRVSDKALSTRAVNIGVESGEFGLGGSNYPIAPEVKFTDNTGTTLPGGTALRFDHSTAAPADASGQSGFGARVTSSDHTGSPVGGPGGDFHGSR
ncbi:hypothetical protein GCM10020295_69300 [Streptomyces cinereospinus]